MGWTFCGFTKLNDKGKSSQNGSEYKNNREILKKENSNN